MINKTEMITLLKKIFHRHNWETTHTNKWYHPTKQKCKCGISRDFGYKDNYKSINGMPWDLGHWVWSNGDTSKYSCAD